MGRQLGETNLFSVTSKSVTRYIHSSSYPSVNEPELKSPARAHCSHEPSRQAPQALSKARPSPAATFTSAFTTIETFGIFETLFG